jgi:hypothetical protein
MPPSPQQEADAVATANFIWERIAGDWWELVEAHLETRKQAARIKVRQMFNHMRKGIGR